MYSSKLTCRWLGGGWCRALSSLRRLGWRVGWRISRSFGWGIGRGVGRGLCCWYRGRGWDCSSTDKIEQVLAVVTAVDDVVLIPGKIPDHYPSKATFVTYLLPMLENVNSVSDHCKSISGDETIFCDIRQYCDQIFDNTND